jgi:hypothetical protein
MDYISLPPVKSCREISTSYSDARVSSREKRGFAPIERFVIARKAIRSDTCSSGGIKGTRQQLVNGMEDVSMGMYSGFVEC